MLFNTSHVHQGGAVNSIMVSSLKANEALNKYTNEVVNSMSQVPLECVTLLTDKYSWIETEPSLNEQLTARLAKNMNLPMD